MSEGFDLKFGDEGDIAKGLRDALGVGDFDRVICLTPQYERIDGKRISYIPKSEDEFLNFINNAPDSILSDVGFGKWDSTQDGKTHWLFPHEWYGSIPDGFNALSISGKEETFRAGVTDDDKRFGLLSFGFSRIQTENP